MENHNSTEERLREDRESRSFCVVGSSRHLRVGRVQGETEAIELIGPMVRLNSEDLAAVVENLSTVLLVIDGAGKLVYANVEAQLMLSRGDALTVDQGGILRCRDRESQLQLRKFLDSVVRNAFLEMGRLQTVLAVSRVDSQPIAARLTCITSHSEVAGQPVIPEKTRIILCVRDPQRLGPQNNHWLMRLYGMSQAEAAVVAMLVGGATVEEIAAERRVSNVTVRNQLKSAHNKAGVSRQAELVSLVLRTTLF